MLFSTLIPTLVHLIIAILGIFVAIYPKHKIKENIEKYEERPSLIYLENASKMIAKRNIIITLFSFATLILIFYFANEYWLTINSSSSSAPFIQNLI